MVSPSGSRGSQLSVNSSAKNRHQSSSSSRLLKYIRQVFTAGRSVRSPAGSWYPSGKWRLLKSQ